MSENYKQLKAKDIAPVLLRIKQSPKFKGIGVFALRDISKGTIICDAKLVAEDFFISGKEFNKLDKETKEVMIDFCAQDEDGYYTPMNLNYLSIPLHMNHSCDGNVGCNDKGNFVAIKNIKKGTEACFDYGLVMSNPNYKLKCCCDSKKCRGIITGNDWLEANFRKNNYQYMSPQLKNLVDETYA